MLDHAKRMKDGAAEPVEAPPLPHDPERSPAILKMPGTTEMPASQTPVEKPKRRPPLTRIAAAVILVLALAAGSWFGIHWWTVGRFFVSTDDAYVGADTATIAAKISGYVTAVVVDNNQHVKTGDVIARIDEGDYRLAVDAARGKVDTQQATVDRIGKQIAAQQAAVEQAKAQIAVAEAGATRAILELKRQQALATRDFASRQTLEQAQASSDQAKASVLSAEAVLQSATASVDVLRVQQEEAARTLKEYQTALARAERDLSFTVIRAPFAGVVGNRAVQTGDYVGPGERLLSLVPLDGVYVDANFKETQVAELKPGQTALLTVDALPGRDIRGSVLSFAPASGSVFSLLPPDNATGNFTKIVQRLPVRIRIPADVARQGVLKPGMSVEVSIDTRRAPDGVAAASR
ncbi:MAG TPA: HlyD family secretion protein [Aestuariivirgaceae bacterium]|jgi:membrane fusion protein, multidrug efflux system|nr:HlyD family secretion protein [Aestuariivirgaceae bacterium]